MDTHSELFSVMSFDEVMVCGVGRVVTDDRVIVLCDYVTSCGVSTQHGTITHSYSITRHLRVRFVVTDHGGGRVV